MKYLRAIIIAASAVFFIAGSALAQNGTVTNHAFAIGKGAGVTGYGSALCTSAQIAVGQSSADPLCKTITGDATLSAAGALTFATVNSNVGSFGSATQCVTLTVNAKGLITAATASTCAPAIGSITGLGTGIASALGNALNASGGLVGFTSAFANIAPSHTRAGDLIYWNGTTWVTLAGNNSGTQFLQETSSGVPSWATVSGTGTVTTLTAGTGISFSSGATCTTSCTVNSTGVISISGGTGIVVTGTTTPVVSLPVDSAILPSNIGLSTTIAVNTMMGWGSTAGGACHITPKYSGRLWVQISGSMSEVSGGSLGVQAHWGTGTGPNNGAGTTGTAFGNTASVNGAGSTGITAPFSIGGVINTGSTGTAIWIDGFVTPASASTTFSGLSCSMHEIL